MKEAIKEIEDLQNLASSLAIQAVTIRDGGQSIIIDWNGEEEHFSSPEAAEAALREAEE